MKISLLKQLQKNLCHPKQATMFRFLKIGYNIFYAFFLALLSALLFSPSIINRSIETSKDLSILFIPLMFVLYYILLAAIFFFYLSLLACLGMGIKQLIPRRLNYQQLWSLSANSCTWPTLALAVLNLIVSLPNQIIWLYILACIGMTTYMISSIPKPKPRPTTKPRPSGELHNKR
ncbi:DUF1189 family protein [Pullulanibacillus camelliae]|uniref:DUF1189 family protein n=1 Tax=Pullulanibacillus camelliae TaxID=1707096 RepID=UPI001665C788|nr:DUF1189 family protein [Pullulanibacillus camelliae]